MFARLISALRQVTEGLGHPAYGCCSGDPIAWEKDLLRQRAEAAACAAADAARRDNPALVDEPAWPTPAQAATAR